MRYNELINSMINFINLIRSIGAKRIRITTHIIHQIPASGISPDPNATKIISAKANRIPKQPFPIILRLTNRSDPYTVIKKRKCGAD